MKHYYRMDEGKDFNKDYLLPYPGVFLNEELDLESHAVEALEQIYPDYGDKYSVEDFVKKAVKTARIKAGEFFSYNKRWETAMDFIDHNQQINKIVVTNCRV